MNPGDLTNMAICYAILSIFGFYIGGWRWVFPLAFSTMIILLAFWLNVRDPIAGVLDVEELWTMELISN